MSVGLQNGITDNLIGCETVVDLCAGPGHWLRHFKARKIGVEANPKYESDLKRNGYEPFIIDVRDYVYDEKVDATIMIDAIEHLEEKDAILLLERVEKNSGKVIVFTPHEFQDNKHNAEALGEPLQEHKSCFPKEFWLKRGYELVLETYNGQDKVHNNLYVKRK